VIAFAMVGCASAPPPPPLDLGPPFDQRAELASLVRRTAVSTPTEIRFEWTAAEPGPQRATGRGVARIQGPENARLDLFLSNGEPVLVAALVGEDLRIPPGIDGSMAPPPLMLWALLGVFRQSSNLMIVDGSRSPDGGVGLSLRTQVGGEYEVLSQGGTLTLMERTEAGRLIEDVQIEPGTDYRFPKTARYRHYPNNRELSVTTISVRTVDHFPPDTWNPGG